MSQRNYDNTPTEYGGVRDNRRNPITGSPTPPMTGQQAQDMRREAICGQGAMSKQDRRAPNRGLEPSGRRPSATVQSGVSRAGVVTSRYVLSVER